MGKIIVKSFIEKIFLKDWYEVDSNGISQKNLKAFCYKRFYKKPRFYVELIIQNVHSHELKYVILLNIFLKNPRH